VIGGPFVAVGFSFEETGREEEEGEGLKIRRKCGIKRATKDRVSAIITAPTTIKWGENRKG
jgi:hypothetical protein